MSDCTVERTPGKKTSKVLKEDKYKSLITNPTAPSARVNISLSQSAEFGAMKVSASVTLSCDQNESTINRAGGLAYEKAYELLVDGWNELNADMQEAAKQG